MEYHEENKGSLEKIKLIKEIEALDTKWYKKPSYLGILIPFILGIASLSYVISNGYFSVRQERLSLQKEKLSFDQSQFEIRKINVLFEIDSLTTSLKNHKDSLVNMTISLDKINSEYNADKQKLLSDSKKRAEIIKALKKDNESNPLNDLIKLKSNISNLEKELKKRIDINNTLQNQSKSYQAEILELKTRINSLKKMKSENNFTKLSGKVLNSVSNLPIPNANVHLINRFNESEKIIVSTNDSGNFSVTVDNNFIYERVKLEVYKNGLKESKYPGQNLGIYNGERTDIILYMN